MKDLLLAASLGAATLGIAAALGAAAREEEATPPVFLNHFFVVIDAESYRALQDSSFVTEVWAPFEKRTTARNDQTYTGIYWYGRRTYFEVFEPGAQGGPGASGVAFSVDKSGGSAAVKAAWTLSRGGVDSALVTRKTETDEVPWFDMTASRGAAGEGLRVWLMEYHKDFLARWYPDRTTARGISRGEVLDRYAAKIGHAGQRETALLRDVTELTMRLDAQEKEKLVQHLKPVGWTVSERGSETVLEGPEGVRLRVAPPEGATRGITEGVFSLQRKVAARSETFGQVRFEMEDLRARLRFAR
jgi:hypothetical protein